MYVCVLIVYFELSFVIFVASKDSRSIPQTILFSNDLHLLKTASSSVRFEFELTLYIFVILVVLPYLILCSYYIHLMVDGLLWNS